MWGLKCQLMFCLRHHQHGRWQARIGRVAGNKDLYLGTFSESFSHTSHTSIYSFLFLQLYSNLKLDLTCIGYT